MPIRYTTYILLSVIICLWVLLQPLAAVADSAKDRYLAADACHRQLLKDTKGQKYRDRWLRCISKFERVYRYNPDGPWAAAGLYNSGRLYGELYGHSYSASDKKAALGLFNRVIKQYPKSKYRAKAAMQIQNFGKKSTAKGSTAGTAAKKRVSRAEKQYLDARSCQNQLLKSPKKQKYRDNWLRCIGKYETAYKKDPSGPRAAQSLYMSGKLYEGLYGKSYIKADKKASTDRYGKVSKRFPDFQFNEKKGVKGSPKSAPKKAVAVKKKIPPEEICYDRLMANPAKQKFRDNWLRCIQKFDIAYRQNPSGPRAAENLYMTGKLYDGLYLKSHSKSDKLAAIRRYDQVVDRFPGTRFGQKAGDAMGRPKTVSKPVKTQTGEAPAYPEGDRKTDDDDIAAVIKKASAAPKGAGSSGKSAKGAYAIVNGLRYWSNPSYTRVVIDADRSTPYTHRLLKKDFSLKKPQRLLVDLSRSRLGADIPKTLPINDDLLIDARAGQYKADKVRVVVDINSFQNYKVFSLRNPFRIVIDVWGEKKQTAPDTRVAKQVPGKNGKLTSGELAKQFALGVSRIVIDPGHGGKDFGAPGYLKGVHEKQIVLKLGKRLAKKIRKEIGCEVILTRSSDRYLTLEERTAIANTKNADLFISIHTNSARNRKAYGIETFFLNLATDDDAILVAARENATSKKNISDLQTILSDLMQNAKINESSRLAAVVQKELYGHMKKRFSKIKNKGVKQAPFYVLLGAQMPAVLVETSFISNPRECRRLTNAKYQDQLCNGIVKGIRQYINEIRPTAHINPSNAAHPSG